jgi:uncharacterized protein (TIRG00374 family)
LATRSPLEPLNAGQRPIVPARGGSSPGRQAARIALLLCGLAVLVLVFRSVGWSAIAPNLARVGGWFAALVVLYGLAQLAFAQGWRVLFDTGRPRPSFGRLFAVYLAGDSFNYLAPGGVAGEPVKARMLRGAASTGDAVASLTIHKHADLLAQWVFVSLGVAIALWRFPLALAARLAALAGAGALGVFLLLLTWGLSRGTYSPLLRWLARWKFLAARLDRFHRPAADLDGRIRDFYRLHRGRYAAATGWCFLGWCGGLLETYLLLKLLVPGSGLPAAFAIEALAMALNSMLIFIPGRVGSAEGVRVGVFLVLGLPAGAGAAFSLARRGREVAWVLPGLIAFLQWQTAQISPAGAPARRLSE